MHVHQSRDRDRFEKYRPLAESDLERHKAESIFICFEEGVSVSSVSLFHGMGLAPL